MIIWGRESFWSYLVNVLHLSSPYLYFIYLPLIHQCAYHSSGKWLKWIIQRHHTDAPHRNCSPGPKVQVPPSASFFMCQIPLSLFSLLLTLSADLPSNICMKKPQMAQCYYKMLHRWTKNNVEWTRMMNKWGQTECFLQGLWHLKLWEPSVSQKKNLL